MQAFYEAISGSYEDAVSRFRDDQRIKKFVKMFLRDPSLQELQQAVEAQNWEAAFRAAHTLKGVAANLAFAKLQQEASALTELLRGRNPLTAEGLGLYQQVMDTAAVVTEEIQRLE